MNRCLHFNRIFQCILWHQLQFTLLSITVYARYEICTRPNYGVLWSVIDSLQWLKHLRLWTPVNFGVLQGSTFIPLLYKLLSAELTKIISILGTQTHQQTDEVQLNLMYLKNASYIYNSSYLECHWEQYKCKQGFTAEVSNRYLMEDQNQFF